MYDLIALETSIVRRPWIPCLFAALAWSLPASAGTLYVPVLQPTAPPASSYTTRIWLTNHGTDRATVSLLFLPEATDGATDRGTPSQVSIDPGTTRVVTREGGTGMLEIQAPEPVVVDSEIRAGGLAGPREVFGNPPVIGSANAAAAGATVVLQGSRRTREGVLTHLGLVNLGHAAGSCDIGLFTAGGASLGGASNMKLPALSHVVISDALGLLAIAQVGDTSFLVSCTRPFYAYLAQQDGGGDLVFFRPSLSGASTLEAPGSSPAPGPGPSPDPGSGNSVVFTRTGVFHAPTRANPTRIFNIPVPSNRTFHDVAVDFDVYHGGWFSKDPSGLHSLFWLNRGAYGGPDNWPPWAGNITGFANVLGPGKNGNLVKVVSNMGLGKSADKAKATARAALEPGKTYHIHFDYDTRKGKAALKVTHGGAQVATAVMPTTVNALRADQDHAWMIYFGHENVFGQNIGAERPTYGWKYQNLRVEFIP